MTFFKDDSRTRTRFKIGLNAEQILITATTGSGKSAFEERLLYSLWKRGCVIISLADPKDELELAFCQFEPREKYHIEALEKYNIPSQKIPIKIYHPFTFNLPTRSLPKMTLFTIPFQSMQKSELSFLAETETEKTSIRILSEAISNLKPHQGLHHLIHLIEKNIENAKEEDVYEENPDTFFAKGSRGGTQKQKGEISTYFYPFKTNYSLTPKNCDLNLDFSKIINDNRQYHLLSTRYIADPKLRAFYILHFINQVVSQQHIARKIIVLHIPEIRTLAPNHTEGYEVYLSSPITKHLSTIRSMGRGMFSVMGTQNWGDVSSSIKDTASVNILGRLSIKDLEAISKAKRWGKSVIDALNEIKIGQFVIIDQQSNIDVDDSIRILMPPHCHKEQTYKYEELLMQEKPEDFMTFEKEIDYMSKLKKSIEEDVLNMVREENKKIKDKANKKFMNKLKKQTVQQQKEKMKIEKTHLKNDFVASNIKEAIYKKYIEYKEYQPDKSLSDIAREFNLYLKDGLTPNKMLVKRIVDRHSNEIAPET